LKYLAILAATRVELEHFMNISCNYLRPLVPSPLSSTPFLLGLITGIGPLNAAIACGHLWGMRHELKGIINIGLAGSFDIRRLPPGSKVLIVKETWPEYGLRTQQGVNPRGIGYGLMKLPGGEILYNEIEIRPEEASEKMGLSFRDKLVTGRSLTVAGVTGDPSLASHFKGLYRVDVENMEGFSIAYWCRLYDIPFLEVRTISNAVGERKGWDIKGALNSLSKVKDILGI